MATAGTNMARIGTRMTAALTVPIVAAGVKMIETAASFESATNILAIAARQSGTPMEDLSRAALTVGKDTQLIGIDAMEAADAMTTFYKTGFTTAEIMGDLNSYLEEGTNLTGALRAAIDLTAASDLDLARASDAVAIAIKTFGLNAADAGAIADSFVGAADASVAEVSDLTDAMYVFGPTANQYGWSLQDTNTALAILSERGIRGAEAGTALRSMMTNMMRDTDETTMALEALGVSLYDQNGQMRALPDIIGQLSSALSGLSDEERNSYIQTIAGTYGMKAMATFVAEGTEGWNNMTEAIAGSASAQEVGEQRTHGFRAAVENLQGAIQTFMITGATPYLDSFLTPGIEKTTDLVNVLADMPPEMQKVAVNTGLALAAAGPLFLIVGNILKLLPVLASPLGILTTGTAALAGAFWTSSENGKMFRDNLHGLAEELSKTEGLEGLGSWVEKVADFADQVAEATQKARDFLAPVKEFIGEQPEEPTSLQDLLEAGVPTGAAIINADIPKSIEQWGNRFFGSGNDPGILGDYIYDMFGYPGGINEYGGVGTEPYGPEPPMEERIYAAPTPEEVASSVFGYPGPGEQGNMWEWPNEWRGINEYGGVGTEPYGPEMPIPGLTALFGEDLTATFQLSVGQTPEEVSALVDNVLPAEGSLKRSVTIIARPDAAQLQRSADEVARAWEQAIALRLERLKKNKLVETGGLLEGAAAVGMAR
jgi:TP901 family phage tail tape measure protein